MTLLLLEASENVLGRVCKKLKGKQVWKAL